MINKINLNQTLDRLLAFAEHRLEDGILVSVRSYYDAENKESEQAYIKECPLITERENCVKLAKTYFEKFDSASLWDFIPVSYPACSFGESIWSGFFGGKITFAGTKNATWSSCEKPVIENFENFNFPDFSMDNFWIRKFLETAKYFVDNIGALCDYTPFIFDDCLNLLVELRGAGNAYMDIYDYPDLIARFMDWSVDLNIKLYDLQSNLFRRTADDAIGKHPYKKYLRSHIPDLSVDAYGVCDTEIYKKWGLEQHKRIVAHYSGGRMHIHANGRHLCKTIATIKGLCYCYLSDDIGYPPPWEILEVLKEELHPVPIAIDIPCEVFIQRLNENTLPGGVLYRLDGVKRTEESKIMKKVFDYSPKNR
ncbi:MAG: hypothetical protein UT30_C0008G0025 [Candidatus Uhrbacteria bacterium GW2011_GWF2_39_13]|uniref:Uroporphyrinogen decarboxylase (URO-D) domain-containing protein n=1 Tax=Candidatus Uhrbacteria bacterium GW2011_GWF2_39_13 TaxID=1618995 RepID=A0A0G0MMR1_9BACT|nr:MAG: hypothetical protein UT30_C0008G0025 [Candidatus Uhrbacteria bacterium GW2011_GWF2_39_13]